MPLPKALNISRHNAACQLVHVVIRISAKGGGVHKAPELVLLTADAGSYPQTSQVSLETLCSTQCTEETVDDGILCSALPTEERVDDRAPLTNIGWLDPLLAIEATGIRRHADVSQDPRYVM